MIQDSARPSAEHAVGEVAVYDFGRSASLSREHARALEVAFETFARQWAPELSARIRGRAHVAVEQVATETYAEYAASLPATTTMVICGFADSDRRVVIQFPLSVASGWIVQMVGGRPIAPIEDRTLTAIDQALVRALMLEAIAQLGGALGDLLPPGLDVIGIQQSSQFAQVAADAEPVIVARLSMRLGGRTIPASVMLPADVVIDGFSTRDSGATPAAISDLMRRQVESAPVDVALRLTPHTVRPADVLALAVGDIIALPHSADRPLDLVVDRQTVATAAVGTSGARLACVVTAITPDIPAEERP